MTVVSGAATHFEGSFTADAARRVITRRGSARHVIGERTRSVTCGGRPGVRVSSVSMIARR